MFTTGATAANPTRLTLTRAAYRAFESSVPAEPTLSAYLSDMGRPYGVRMRAADTGHSHAAMAATLIEELDDHQPIDVLVLAQRMHDVHPGRATATYLGSRCAGTPLAFAVADQGTAAPFTALRLLESYARGGVCTRALLLVVEQATLHYEPVKPVKLPDRHTAVALLLAAGDPQAVTVRQRIDVTDPLSIMDNAVAELCNGHADPVVLYGAGMSGPMALPLTGLWWQLAAGRARWAGRRVILVDHDADMRLFSVAALDLPKEG